MVIPPRRDVPGVSYDVAITKSLIVNRMVHEAAHAFLWCCYLALDNRIEDEEELRFEWGPKPKVRALGIIHTRLPADKAAPLRLLHPTVTLRFLTAQWNAKLRKIYDHNTYTQMSRSWAYGVCMMLDDGVHAAMLKTDAYGALISTAILQLAGDVTMLEHLEQDVWAIRSDTNTPIISPLALRAYAATQTTTVG